MNKNHNLDSTSIFFVARLKSNADIEVAEKYLTNEKHEHILSDQDILLKGFYSYSTTPRSYA